MHVLIVSDADSRYGASHSLKQMVKELLNSYENDLVIDITSNRLQLWDRIAKVVRVI